MYQTEAARLLGDVLSWVLANYMALEVLIFGLYLVHLMAQNDHKRRGSRGGGGGSSGAGYTGGSGFDGGGHCRGGGE